MRAAPGRRGRRRRWALLGALALLAGALAPPAPGAGKEALEDLLFDFQLVPLDGRAPAPFTLERYTDRRPVSLAELRGRPVLLYFWATW
jgi:hypothetical protein